MPLCLRYRSVVVTPGPPAPSPAFDYHFLILIVPPMFILLLATGLFEFSSNITVDNFHTLTNWLGGSV